MDIAAWTRAEAGQAAALARVAGRLGALDDRLARGPQGWRHRLALREAAQLGWALGLRVGQDRLAQWLALRLNGPQDDAIALGRLGWAVRRLSGGPSPDLDLAGFAANRDGGQPDPATRGAAPAAVPSGRGVTDVWQMFPAAVAALHPVTRGAVFLHLWPQALPVDMTGDPLLGAVAGVRLAASGLQGAPFLPVDAAGAALRMDGDAHARLARWYAGAESATLAALRHLDAVEQWQTRARDTCRDLSGRTVPVLIDLFAAWPLLSAPMAEPLSGASRAAVQRNLATLQQRGLIREVTGQGRYRYWAARV